jgi:hypothetical protein
MALAFVRAILFPTLSVVIYKKKHYSEGLLETNVVCKQKLKDSDDGI